MTHECEQWDSGATKESLYVFPRVHQPVCRDAARATLQILYPCPGAHVNVGGCHQYRRGQRAGVWTLLFRRACVVQVVPMAGIL